MRNTALYVGVGLMALFGLSACEKGPSTLDIQEMCENTVHAYSFARDSGNEAALLGIFTEDAVLTLFGKDQTGRAEIVKAALARAKAQNTRHMITSVNVDVSNAGPIMGQSYVAIFNGPNADSAATPIASPEPFALATYNDEFELIADKCLISKRIVVVDYITQN